MHDSILNFAKQFEWTPEIENQGRLAKYEHFCVSGMGGSHLAADILRSWKPDLPIRVHPDYGLPAVQDNTLFILSSYSGNTEEVISGFEECVKRNLACCVIASGGKLIELAKEHSMSFVQMPSEGIQPRVALGYSLRGILALIGRTDLLEETNGLASRLVPQEMEAKGEELAERLKGSLPIIYASSRNRAIALNWKIKLNETAKIPAFYNMIPELNHNEMTGFDIVDATRALSQNMHFILLKDSEDLAQNQKRIEVLEKLYTDRGLGVEPLELIGNTRLERIFNSLLLADWTALHLAVVYSVEAEEVPMVEEFKKMIK